MVAKRLRIYTQHANNALTIPSFLEQRFHDQSGAIRLVSALTILVFFYFLHLSRYVQRCLIVSRNFRISYLQALINWLVHYCALHLCRWLFSSQLD